MTVKHGAYTALSKRKIDKRTTLGKWIKNIRQALVTDLGGDVTAAQSILIDRIKFKVCACHFMEQAVARGEIPSWHDYAAVTNSLRADLQLLGLERRQKDYISYLDEINSVKKRHGSGQGEK